MKKTALLTTCMLLSSLSLAADIGGIRLGDDLAAAQARIAALLPEVTATPAKVRFTIPLGEHGVRSTGEFETWIYTQRVSSTRTISWAVSASPDTGKVWMISHANSGLNEGRIPLGQFSASLTKFGSISDSLQRLNAGTDKHYSQSWSKNARGGGSAAARRPVRQALRQDESCRHGRSLLRADGYQPPLRGCLRRLSQRQRGCRTELPRLGERPHCLPAVVRPARPGEKGRTRSRSRPRRQTRILNTTGEA